MTTGAEILAQLNMTLPQLISLAVVAVWEMIWTGIAMWKAARNNHKALFILFFVVNLFGIPEIVYIFGFKQKPRLQAKNKRKR